MNPQPEHYPVEWSESVTAGLAREWYAERKVVAYLVRSLTDETLRQWQRLTLETLEAWDKSTPYRAIHDLSTPGVATLFSALVNYDLMNVGVVPAGKRAAEDVFNQHPLWMGRVALVFNFSLSGQLGKVMQQQYLDKHPSIQFKSFFSHDMAVHWLLSSDMVKG